MKKLIILLVGLGMMCGIASAYTTQSTMESSAATTEAITEITFEATSIDIIIFNDSSTTGEDIYFNPESDLTIARITNEGWIVKAGENHSFDDFRTRRVRLISILGAPNYRVGATYNN